MRRKLRKWGFDFLEQELYIDILSGGKQKIRSSAFTADDRIWFSSCSKFSYFFDGFILSETVFLHDFGDDLVIR